MRVYLIGPITGQSPDQISDWRSALRQMSKGLDFFDPASAEIDTENAYARHEGPSDALRRLSHGRFVLDRNRALIRASDVAFANFLSSPDRASIGSIGELFWANSFAKPVIIVRQQSHNIHDHAMLNALATRICYSLEEGRDALYSLALPDYNMA